jgi:hypothetical protein
MAGDIRRRVSAEPVDRLAAVRRPLKAMPSSNTLICSGAVDAGPGFLGFLDQFECQTQEGWSRHAVVRARSAVAHGRERRLNRIRRPQMLPVLGRKS